MRYALVVVAGLLAAGFTGSIVADVVDVQPPDAYNTVMGTSGWLPGEKVYSLANTSLDWVYWQGDIASGQAICIPAAGWIAPGESMNITICPAPSMATASPGTYSDQVTLGFDPRLVGDVTGDGNSDVEDLLTLVSAFGTQAGDPAYDITCDFNSDGFVDIVDLLHLVDTFGMTYGSLEA
jgi:hypothetical protein